MAPSPTITFHGAARTVTGSCMEFDDGDRRLLVDCGLFQGSRTLETLNRRRFRFDPKRVDALILTHAHIDHCGLIPRLVTEGFAGRIWCTPATADLLPIMLADAGRIQEGDAARRNRRRDRADEPPVSALYTEQDAIAAARRAQPVALGEWFAPANGVRARFWNAGHILGAASVEIEMAGSRILCSGDLGPGNKSFEPPPDGPSGIDHLVCEATYGGRLRLHLTSVDRRALLEAEIKAALARKGNLVIPVFALERTQELLLDIALLIESGRIPDRTVFIDSPLAAAATGVFGKYADTLEGLGGRHVFDRAGFHFVQDSAQSIALNHMSGAIILAASGMCEAGRVRHHLKHNLARPESTILFVGFQAQGTLGRVILEGAHRVRIWGEEVAVRARIRRIDSYSAHADQDELFGWIEKRRPISGSIFLSHGEEASCAALSARLAAGGSASEVIIPLLGETFALPANAAAGKTAEADQLAAAALGPDWQNSYADFTGRLKARLKTIADPLERRRAIDELAAVLDKHGC